MKNTINGRQISLLIALANILVIAFCLYGMGGALFLTAISSVILMFFFRKLSTESLKIQNEAMATAEDNWDDYDTVYNPMYCSLEQNIYHQH